MRRIELEALTYKLNARQIEHLIIEKETLEIATHRFSKLSGYQQLLISLHLGLYGGKAYTLRELGKRFEISRKQASRDFHKALGFLKGPQMQKGKSK